MSAISKQLKYIREAARASAASSIARHNVEARNANKKNPMQLRNKTIVNRKLNKFLFLLALLTFIIGMMLPVGLIGMWIYALDGGGDIPLMEKYLLLITVGSAGLLISYSALKYSNRMTEE